MKIGDNIAARLRLAGYRVCSACQEVLDSITIKGAEWTQQHTQQLARMLHSNLRKTQGRIPQELRRRWIERQMELAIKQSRKSPKNKVQQ